MKKTTSDGSVASKSVAKSVASKSVVTKSVSTKSNKKTPAKKTAAKKKSSTKKKPTQGNSMTGYVYRGKIVRSYDNPLAEDFPYVPPVPPEDTDKKPAAKKDELTVELTPVQSSNPNSSSVVGQYVTPNILNVPNVANVNESFPSGFYSPVPYATPGVSSH